MQVLEAPQLTIQPPELNFGIAEESLAFTIENSHNGTLSWSIEATPPWLTVNQTTGKNPPLTQTTINVNAKRQALSSGTYETGIVIKSNDVLKIILSPVA